MFTLITLLARALRSEPATGASPSPRQLMERAGARAGQDPRDARELRAAASAWLRVIR
jgi:hypothetical protein